MEFQTLGHRLLRTNIMLMVIFAVVQFQPICTDTGEEKMRNYLKRRVEQPNDVGVLGVENDDSNLSDGEEVSYIPVMKQPSYIHSPYMIGTYPAVQRFSSNKQARLLTPYTLRHFLASRFKNSDYDKRMGSEFLGKRSGDVRMLAPEKKMGSEFLGRRKRSTVDGQ